MFATCSSIPPNNCRLETENWLLRFLLETFFDFFLPHRSYAFVFMFCGNCFSFVIFLSFEGQNFIWDDLNFAHVFLNLHPLVIGYSQAFWGFIPTTGSALDAQVNFAPCFQIFPPPLSHKTVELFVTAVLKITVITVSVYFAYFSLLDENDALRFPETFLSSCFFFTCYLEQSPTLLVNGK